MLMKMQLYVDIVNLQLMLSNDMILNVNNYILLSNFCVEISKESGARSSDVIYCCIEKLI